MREIHAIIEQTTLRSEKCEHQMTNLWIARDSSRFSSQFQLIEARQVLLKAAIPSKKK